MATNAPDVLAIEKPELETKPRKRTIGPVSTAGGAGSSFGGSLAVLIIAMFNLDLTAEAATALAVVVSTVSVFIGGYLVPNQRAKFEAEMADALTMTQAEKQELVESAARNAAYITTPDYSALVDQALATRELSTSRAAETQPVPEATPAVADATPAVPDAGNGLALYSLNGIDVTADSK